jgi:hypothetical protein
MVVHSNDRWSQASFGQTRQERVMPLTVEFTAERSADHHSDVIGEV